MRFSCRVCITFETTLDSPCRCVVSMLRTDEVSVVIRATLITIL